MFKIKRHGKRFNNKTFSSYEEARNYVRRWVRKVTRESLLSGDYSVLVQRSPSISLNGFSVVKG